MLTKLFMRRGFASQTVVQPLTVTQLKDMGQKNLSLSKTIDYSEVADPAKYGLGTQMDTYRGLEDAINMANFGDLVKTEAIDRNSRRTGLLAYKMGMTHYWDRWGKHVPCTVLQVDRCQVIQVKQKERDGCDAIQVGCGDKDIRKLKKAQAGHFLRYGLPPKQDLAEFPVTPECFLPIGYMLGPRHFHIGQWVDVQSTSKGKGFQGVMKRWNFSGQGASHGNSRAHRLPGSIGQAEYPGKVWKGKKMAGQLGNRSATVLNQMVVRIDVPRSLLYIQGNVPGAPGSLVRVRDAVKRTEKQWWDLQYPTYIADSESILEEKLVWDGGDEDPYENFYHENDVVSGAQDD